ncbi:MAG: [protein-PII] uridylyltransferase [Parvibaculaceae bacterium]
MTPAKKPPALVDGPLLRRSLADLETGPDHRRRVVAVLKETITAARAEAERRLTADGKGTQCAMLLAAAQDEIIHALYDHAVRKVYRAPNPSEAERLTVVAVGGYGRGTLAPGSDIDLLFLLPYKRTGWSESVIEFILYALWDTRLKVGHATRSVDDCIRLAQSDSTILTAILEARFICGEPSLFETLNRRFRKEIAAKGAKAFVASKLAERDERHFKAGESRYLVEPDVKNGKGGLRDLHTLFWIAKFLSGANSTKELAEKGVFTREELALFVKSEDFLWAVRCHLHFLAGRAEDRLSFDRQPDLAERLGYKAHAGLRHVERFMKHYFLVAKDVGDLTRIFSASLEAQEMKPTPVLGRVLGRFAQRRSGRVEGAPDFRIEANRLTIAGEDALTGRPVNIIRLFALAAEKDLEIHPDALKAVRRNLARIDKDLRAEPEANALFLAMLTEARDPETALRRMNEAGVLGRFIPEFGRIVAMMQFNMYHHYTVDEHLIRAVGILAAIERGRFSSDHPLSTEIFPTLSSRRALYVAVLLHDIAKGRKESHSTAGERVAKTLCPRLGLSAPETETVAWLVRHHLLMSETAQMRDLNDFKTILDFANVVQSPQRLKLLLILTVADVRAVGPTAWNGWKGQLLRTLYFETEPILSGGHTSISRKERVAEAQAKFFAHYPGWTGDEKDAYAARHYDAYWLNVDTERQVAHEKLMARARREGEPVATAVRTDEFTAITELTIHAPDHPRFLALITGACAAANANIVGAQIFTTADGLALDTILIQRQFADSDDERRRAERVAGLVRQVLKGEVRIKDLIARVQHPESRLQAFTVPPRVIIDNESSNLFTVIEVNGLDRVGILYDLTEALYHLNLNIGSAHITTYGERVIDVFYVTDLTGAKIVGAARRAEIERRLLAVLAKREPAGG